MTSVGIEQSRTDHVAGKFGHFDFAADDDDVVVVVDADDAVVVMGRLGEQHSSLGCSVDRSAR